MCSYVIADSEQESICLTMHVMLNYFYNIHNTVALCLYDIMTSIDKLYG